MSLILSGTDGLSDVDGSAATPAIRGTDANTGIFFPAADTIAFAEGGVESMRIDSAGNVGIGTTAPAAKLHVEGGSENAIIGSSTRKLYFRADGNGVSVLDAAVQSGNGLYVNSVNSYVATYTGSTERLRIASAGQLGIGGANYGTAGQVLTSGGSGAAPTWATPSAGAMVLISTQTASASASLDFTGLSTYTRYMLLLENIVPATNNVQTRLQIGTGATPTYATSNYSCGTDAYEGGANGFIITAGNFSVSNGGLNATITLMAPVAGYPGYLVTSAWFDGNGETLARFAAGGGRYTSTATVTAFRLIFSSGNITSGKASLYGITS
jgi:hypothetical protein